MCCHALNVSYCLVLTYPYLPKQKMKHSCKPIHTFETEVFALLRPITPPREAGYRPPTLESIEESAASTSELKPTSEEEKPTGEELSEHITKHQQWDQGR